MAVAVGGKDVAVGEIGVGDSKTAGKFGVLVEQAVNISNNRTSARFSVTIILIIPDTDQIMEPGLERSL
jgi:hypothetical protein